MKNIIKKYLLFNILAYNCLERAFYALLVSLVATADENISARSTVRSNP